MSSRCHGSSWKVDHKIQSTTHDPKRTNQKLVDTRIRLTLLELVNGESHEIVKRDQRLRKIGDNGFGQTIIGNLLLVCNLFQFDCLFVCLFITLHKLLSIFQSCCLHGYIQTKGHFKSDMHVLSVLQLCWQFFCMCPVWNLWDTGLSPWSATVRTDKTPEQQTPQECTKERRRN